MCFGRICVSLWLQLKTIVDSGQLFLLRAAGFLLPCYIMAWAISILQRRRQRQVGRLFGSLFYFFVWALLVSSTDMKNLKYFPDALMWGSNNGSGLDKKVIASLHVAKEIGDTLQRLLLTEIIINLREGLVIQINKEAVVACISRWISAVV